MWVLRLAVVTKRFCATGIRLKDFCLPPRHFRELQRRWQHRCSRGGNLQHVPTGAEVSRG